MRQCNTPKVVEDFYFINKNKSNKRTSYCKKCDNKNSLKYAKNNRAKINKHRNKKMKKTPWVSIYVSINRRVKDPKRCYCKRGIKNYLTQEQIKELWFRDKAWLLKKASIDRIDTYGDYEFGNCRFIELAENLARKRASCIRKKKYIFNEHDLYHKYITEKKSIRQIANEFKCSTHPVVDGLKKYNINKSYISTVGEK